MNRRFKKICLITLICILLTGCGTKKNNKNESKKDNQVKIELKDDSIVKEQTIDGLKISNVKMEVIDGITTYTASITNITNSNIEVDNIKIVVKDDKNDILATLTGYIGAILKPNDTKNIVNTTDIDLSKAKSISYEK